MEQLEEWNEFGEVKEAIGEVATTATSVTTTPAKAPSTSIPTVGTSSKPAAVAASAASASTENALPTAQSSVLRQLADEAASTVQEKKKSPVPAPLSSTTNPPASGVSAVEPSFTKDNTPLSPSSVPLPATPSITSPPPRGTNSPMRVASPLASPRPGQHGRHGSNSSTHSQSHFVPEHFDAPPIAHRGSSLSIASEEEIKKIENDATIHEAEEEEDCEDAYKAEQKAEKLKEKEKVLDLKKVPDTEASPKEEAAPTKTIEEIPAKKTEEKESPIKKAENLLAEAIDKVKIADKEAPAE
jgi:hypothetical protein